MTRRAGGYVDAADFAPVRYKRKAANESVTSSTTMQDDNDIAGIALDADKVYLVDFYPSVSAAAAAGDVKFGWTTTGGVAGLGTRVCRGPQTGTTDATNTAMRVSRHNLTTAVPYGHDGSTTCAIHETFLVETSAGAGTLTLRWAQNASSGTATTLSTSTYVVVTEVEEIT